MINKQSLLSSIKLLTESKDWQSAEQKILSAIDDFSMADKIKKGVVLGFSGGSDSILLLIFLWNFRNNHNFSLKALHVNHLIRGDEADADEAFAKEFAEALEVEFEAAREDVPSYCASRSVSTEEGAREIRYRAFERALAAGGKYATIATAHNATDNLETFIFNVFRGSGIRGLCGIPPVRDNIIRPLIYLSKNEITELLSEFNVPFVTDSTNYSVEYTRNYIRHEILPKLTRLNPSPEDAIRKVTANIRKDADLIDKCASRFLDKHCKDGYIETESLKNSDEALFAAVISRFLCGYNKINLEKIHFDKLYELILADKDFEYDIPSGAAFFSKAGRLYVGQRSKDKPRFEFFNEIDLKVGFTEIPELDLGVLISTDKNEEYSSNVYKISMKTSLPNDIINNGLYLRTKREGDSYRYGGHTRKLKKLFNDKKLTEEEKLKTPVLCDKLGIVWVPGFGIREDIENKKRDLWISIYIRSEA